MIDIQSRISPINGYKSIYQCKEEEEEVVIAVLFIGLVVRKLI